MPFYSTMAETDIACAAMDVYSYITNPANWEDGRPVTDPGWTLVPPSRQPAGSTWRAHDRLGSRGGRDSRGRRRQPIVR